jgi:hypothetical protein
MLIDCSVEAADTRLVILDRLVVEWLYRVSHRGFILSLTLQTIAMEIKLGIHCDRGDKKGHVYIYIYIYIYICGRSVGIVRSRTQTMEYLYICIYIYIYVYMYIHLIPGEMDLCFLWVEDYMDSKIGLDTVAERDVSCTRRESNPRTEERQRDTLGIHFWPQCVTSRISMKLPRIVVMVSARGVHGELFLFRNPSQTLASIIKTFCSGPQSAALLLLLFLPHRKYQTWCFGLFETASISR